MSKQTIHIILVDDQSLFREGMKAILNTPDFSIIGEAAEGNELFDLLDVKKLKPDIILLDIDMPNGMSGLQTLSKLGYQYPTIKVIMLSMFDDELMKRKYIGMGAKAYLTKRTEYNVLTETIRKVYQWHDYSNVNTTGKSVFTRRQLNIIPLLMNGFKNSEIAERISVSVKTVELERANIYEKAGVGSYTEFLAYGNERGFKYLDLV